MRPSSRRLRRGRREAAEAEAPPHRSPNGWRRPSRRRAAKPGATGRCSICCRSGILIYRLDRLLYANPAFLARMGYASLHALEEAGGLDALYVEPGVSIASSTSEAGTPVTISASQPPAAAPRRPMRASIPSPGTTIRRWR